MRLEAPWTTARRLLSRNVAIDKADRPPQPVELDTEALVARINDRIITFQERRQQRVHE